MIQAQLKRLETAFDRFYLWLGKLYDPEVGGFYYQLSSLRHPERFQPDLESTGQAVACLASSGLIQDLSPIEHDRLAHFFQRHQNPDGYFRAEGPDRYNTERMLGRYLDYARRSLDWLEVEPRYPLPKTFVSDLANVALEPDAVRTWLDQRPWDNGWLAVDQISARAQILYNLDNPIATRAIDVILDYLTEKQDPGTGLWGGGCSYQRVSGAFKATIAFNNRRPLPNPDAIFRSLMDCIRSGPANRMTWVSNPLNLYSALEHQLSRPISYTDRTDLIRLSIDHLLSCLRDDGGFSIEASGSWAAPNDGIELGLGLAEGDMNSAHLAVHVWQNLLRIADQISRPPRSAPDFWQTARVASKSIPPSTPRIVISTTSAQHSGLTT